MHRLEISGWAKLTGKTEDDVRREAIATIPWGRLGTPEDIAKVAVFLASQDNEYMTGRAINVTGGNETH
jgi:NAD(P)-dependent dehydrogenase (short-subunit alcohol dehydrogenase family)